MDPKKLEQDNIQMKQILDKINLENSNLRQQLAMLQQG